MKKLNMSPICLMAVAISFAGLRPLVAAESLDVISPVPGMLMTLQTDGQRSYYALSAQERREGFVSQSFRDEMGKPREKVNGEYRALYWPRAIQFKWAAEEGVEYAFSIREKKSGATFLSAAVKGGEIWVDNFEIGRTYDWQAAGGGKVAKGAFRTARETPRLVRMPGVENCRDLGGRLVPGGKIVRQGRIYRTAQFDGDNLDAAYIRSRFGIRTDLDLRGSGENKGRDDSPLGSDVQYLHYPAKQYEGLDTADGKKAFSDAFRVFLDEANYPIAFHCIYGQDRTGSLAFVLEALLGVDLDELMRDWETTGFWLRYTSTNHAECIDKLKVALDSYGAATLTENAERYVLSCGFAADDISRFRSLMLEEAPDPTVPEIREDGQRVISVSFANSSTLMSGDQADGSLVGSGVPASSWKNILNTDASPAVGLTLWDGTRGTSSPLPDASVTYSGTFYHASGYPLPFQSYHLEGADVTFQGIPFVRYDVILYYSVSHTGGSYGCFAAAKVNGRDWTWNGSEMVQGSTGSWNDVDHHQALPQIGLNALRIDSETSPTLTVKTAGKGGYFYIAGLQVVERPVKSLSFLGDVSVSDINAGAPADDDLVRVLLADGATLTVDGDLAGSLTRVYLECAGSVRLVADADVTEEQRQGVRSKLDATRVTGGVTCDWSRRIISVNFTSSTSSTQMTGDEADGSLAGIGIPASSWKNIVDPNGGQKCEGQVSEGLPIWDEAQGTVVSLDDASVEFSGTFYHAYNYPLAFQLRHLEGADVVVRGIPFPRYDVILYYSVQYMNESYGYFSAAKVNGTDWTWNGSEMVQGSTGKWNDCVNHKALPQIGLNALRVNGETSPTLTLKSAGTGGSFHLAGFQVVESPVREIAAGKATSISAINAMAPSDDDTVAVRLGRRARLTIDAEVVASLKRIVLLGEGGLTIVLKPGLSVEQRDAVVDRLDLTRIVGEVLCRWGGRVLSVNYAEESQPARTVRTDTDCEGELVRVGSAAGWNNVTATGVLRSPVIWELSKATVADSVTVTSEGTVYHPNLDHITYPSSFQNSHLRDAKITVGNIPFARYDVFVYYSARQHNNTYGRFSAAKVNGTSWTYRYTGDGTTDVGEMVKGDSAWTHYTIDGKEVIELAEAPKLGHNVLIVRGETSPTLTLEKGADGYFDVAAVQVVETRRRIEDALTLLVR